MTTIRPTQHVAVIMRRQRVDGPMRRWQAWRWVLDSVVPHEEGFGLQPRLLRDDDGAQHWLHPGFEVALFGDDSEGYYLNVTTDAPCWFVMWRLQEDPAWGAEPMPVPCMVSLSYHDAGRWLDAQETVEQVPVPPDVRAWLQAFVDEHHVIEPKRRKRPESFRSLQDRFGNPASISVGKKGGAGHG